MSDNSAPVGGPRVKCKHCGSVIQSRHVHDMVWCSCGKIAIDGGGQYTRMTGSPRDMEFLGRDPKP